ncbi:hypothetical protein ACFRAQ_28050 [Nocardia sp. NPDC056611]|uniref:hypothetical protein n=1 Tax=Nocardia sp. NPDC056611 TaxID=3345877 RepID=UPI00366CEBE6
MDAFLDTHGNGYVDLRWSGVVPQRIDIIADYQVAAKYGFWTDGGAEAGQGAEILGELAGLIAEGSLEVPIANVLTT